MANKTTNIAETKFEKASRKTSRKEVDVDMNPMVDLAFLLLTFFMLTTTFKRPQAMELIMPAKADETAIEQEQPIKESKALSIVLGDENRIFWYIGITEPEVFETKYNKEGLRNLLLEKKASIADLVVLIKPTKESNYQNLVDVLDEMKISAIQRYTILDAETEENLLIAKFYE